MIGEVERRHHAAKGEKKKDRQKRTVQSQRRKSKNRNLEKRGWREDGVHLRIRYAAVWVNTRSDGVPAKLKRVVF